MPLTVVPTGLRTVVLAVDGVDVATLDRLRAAGRCRRSIGCWARASRRCRRMRIAIRRACGRRSRRVSRRNVTASARSNRARSRASAAGCAPNRASGRRSPAATDRAAAHAAGDRVGRRALEPGVLGSRRARRTAHCGRPLVGDLAGAGDAGIVLSDRAILRLEHGGPLDGEIAPAALYEALRQSVAGAARARGGRARVCWPRPTVPRSSHPPCAARPNWTRRSSTSRPMPPSRHARSAGGLPARARHRAAHAPRIGGRRGPGAVGRRRAGRPRSSATTSFSTMRSAVCSRRAGARDRIVDARHAAGPARCAGERAPGASAASRGGDTAGRR